MLSLTVGIHDGDNCRPSVKWYKNKAWLCCKWRHCHLECLLTSLQNTIRIDWNTDAGLVTCTTSRWECHIGWNLSEITSTCIDTNIIHKSGGDNHRQLNFTVHLYFTTTLFPQSEILCTKHPSWKSCRSWSVVLQIQ